jgi:hypothetical protein
MPWLDIKILLTKNCLDLQYQQFFVARIFKNWAYLLIIQRQGRRNERRGSGHHAAVTSKLCRALPSDPADLPSAWEVSTVAFSTSPPVLTEKFLARWLRDWRGGGHIFNIAFNKTKYNRKISPQCAVRLARWHGCTRLQWVTHSSYSRSTSKLTCCVELLIPL